MTMRPLLALLLSVLGCSTGGSGSPTGVSFDYCAAKADRASRCESGVVAGADCKQEQACYDQIIRPDERDGILRCFATRACGASDDPCVNEPARKYASDPAVTGWIDTCTAKLGACSGSFSDDLCSTQFGVLSDAARAALRECMNKPCNEVSGCYKNTFASFGCD